MGRKKGSSWFAVIKRAFCSPSKGCNNKNTGKRGEIEQQDDQDKKGEKGRWVSKCQHNQEKIDDMNKDPIRVDLDQTRAIVAEAAAATAHAAAEIARLTRRSNFIRKCYNAAVGIQAAFRGYLARRALMALKGIVKLQAVIRGHNVRKQAKLTLRCVKALIRLQAQMCDQQARLSHERSRKSMFAETESLWDRYSQDIRQRKSTSAGRNSTTTDEWDFIPCISEDDENAFKSKNDAALKREKALAYALSQQLRRFDRDISNRSEWLNRWMATKQWDSFTMRGLNDRRDSIRCLKEERSHSTVNTPSSCSKYSCISGVSDFGAATPHYMTSTESAKAKRILNQRLSTPGRERVRKRLTYPVAEQFCSDYTDNSGFSQSLRSPSLERGAYPDSYYGENSPASTTHLRRWLN